MARFFKLWATTPWEVLSEFDESYKNVACTVKANPLQTFSGQAGCLFYSLPTYLGCCGSNKSSSSLCPTQTLTSRACCLLPLVFSHPACYTFFPFTGEGTEGSVPFGSNCAIPLPSLFQPRWAKAKQVFPMLLCSLSGCSGSLVVQTS